jgi:hypothetical protein
MKCNSIIAREHVHYILVYTYKYQEVQEGCIPHYVPLSRALNPAGLVVVLTYPAHAAVCLPLKPWQSTCSKCNTIFHWFTSCSNVLNTNSKTNKTCNSTLRQIRLNFSTKNNNTPDIRQFSFSTIFPPHANAILSRNVHLSAPIG